MWPQLSLLLGWWSALPLGSFTDVPWMLLLSAEWCWNLTYVKTLHVHNITMFSMEPGALEHLSRPAPLPSSPGAIKAKLHRSGIRIIMET
jgi:hypothetical protein